MKEIVRVSTTLASIAEISGVLALHSGSSIRFSGSGQGECNCKLLLGLNVPENKVEAESFFDMLNHLECLGVIRFEENLSSDPKRF